MVVDNKCKAAKTFNVSILFLFSAVIQADLYNEKNVEKIIARPFIA